MQKNKVKKYEDSFSDKSDQDETQIQTAQQRGHIHIKHIRITKQHSKHKIEQIEPKRLQNKKSEETKNKKHIKKIDDTKNQSSEILKKQEGLKFIKDDEQTEKRESKNKNSVASKSKIKQTKKSQKLEELQRKANQIIDAMDQAYEADVGLYRRQKPADNKLKLILQIQKKLKEVDLARVFLGLGGILLFIQWLLPNGQTQQETSLTVKIHIMNLLMDLNLEKQHIQSTDELQKVLRRYRKSRFEMLRDLSSKIVEKWKLLRATLNS